MAEPFKNIMLRVTKWAVFCAVLNRYPRKYICRTYQFKRAIQLDILRDSNDLNQYLCLRA